MPTYWKSWEDVERRNCSCETSQTLAELPPSNQNEAISFRPSLKSKTPTLSAPCTTKASMTYIITLLAYCTQEIRSREIRKTWQVESHSSIMSTNYFLLESVLAIHTTHSIFYHPVGSDQQLSPQIFPCIITSLQLTCVLDTPTLRRGSSTLYPVFGSFSPLRAGSSLGSSLFNQSTHTVRSPSSILHMECKKYAPTRYILVY